MPVSDPDVSRPRLIRDASFLEADRREIALRRGRHNRLGFAYQVAFVRVLGRFPQQAPLEIDGEILRFAALQLGADAETIHAYAGRQQTVSEHQQRIGEYLRLGAFDAAAPDFPFDPDLLRHVSPIEWKNVILYGEIKIDPAKLKLREP